MKQAEQDEIMKDVRHGVELAVRDQQFARNWNEKQIQEHVDKLMAANTSLAGDLKGEHGEINKGLEFSKDMPPQQTLFLSFTRSGIGKEGRYQLVLAVSEEEAIAKIMKEYPNRYHSPKIIPTIK